MIDLYYFLTAFWAALLGNIFVRAMVIAICADMLFGSLRAAKYRCWNSAVGIDGGIRKAGMVSAILVLTLMDMLLDVNLIGWLDSSALEVLAEIGVVKIGITEMFSLLFLCYEATSVLKNMLLCGIPIPKGLREKLEDWMREHTEETEALSKE